MEAQVTNSSQITVKNDAWVAVTVQIQKDDGSTSQVQYIEPRSGKH